MLASIGNNLVKDTAIPGNISYFWNIGSLLGLNLVVQIITGVLISFHYIPSTISAFDSIQSIMIEENYGWLIRYSHANGASTFFALVYIHIGRALYYGSFKFPRVLLWSIGVIIYVLMMAIAFIGYVLVWGSMSLWGSIVITNFFSVIPWIGISLVLFIWGGFSVDYPTLNRFYGLHYTLPWILAAFVILHILALHDVLSNNPNGINAVSDLRLFHPNFTYKDYITFILYFIILIILIGYYPNVLGHPDNYIKANPLVTPSSIVPEWYFLPFYGILRSVTNKSLGVIAMALSIASLFILPYISFDIIRSNQYKLLSTINYWSFVGNFILLLFIGGLPVEYPYILIGKLATFYYFTSLLIIPLIIAIIQYVINY